MDNNKKNILDRLFDNKFLFNQIFNNSFESIFIVDNNTIIYCNDSCKELLNNEIINIESKNFSDLFYELEKEMIDAFFYESIKNPGIEFNELLRLKKNGNGELYCETKIKPLIVKDKVVFLVFINDITANIKSEKINMALYSIAKAVNTTDSIEQLYDEIHYSVNEIIDVKNFFIAIYNKENDTIEFPFFKDEKDEKFTIIINASDKRSLTASVIRNNKPLFLKEQEINDYFSDDKIPWGTLSKVWLAVPLRIENEVIGAIGAQSYDNPNLYSENDINLFETLAEQIAISLAWKFTDEKLKQSEDKFKKAFKTSPDAININRLKDGLYVDINEGFTRTTGYTEDDVIGKTSLELDIWVEPKDRELLVKYLKKDGFYKNLEAKFKFKNGVIHTGLMSAVVITLNNEPHILSITRDIQEVINAREEIIKLNLELEQKVIERTAQLSDALEEVRDEIEKRKSIEKELLRYQNELANALKSEIKLNKIKSRFINMISHEYRTPLTIISTSAELLDKFYKEGNYELHIKHTQRILSTIDDMIKLIDDVLDIGRVEISGFEVNFKEINIVGSIYKLIEKYELIDKNKHKIDFNYSDETILLKTDELLFKQIIENLLANAIKYTPEGKNIFINIENHKSYISFEITDEGIGIPETDLENIFNHFYRAENAKNIGGTGLGLSIVKRNVEALNGFISLTSVINEGTTFNVKLPKIKPFI